MKKIVLFGAGKIGRSFIGQLFSKGGYEVVFIDINHELITALNKNKSYTVVIKSDQGDISWLIDNVRGINLEDKEAIIHEIKSCSLLASSVGLQNLSAVFPVIGEGLKKKYVNDKAKPTDIIIAENIRNGADYFSKELAMFLSLELIEKNIGFVETSIGKMVPIMSKADMQEDITQVFAEPYNTLILDKKGFKNPIPEIPGLSPKENIKAWVDRKSLIHNLGHAATAYFGYLKHPEKTYLYEILANPEVESFSIKTMLESGKILQKKYPGEFTNQHIQDHIENLLSRFQNRNLGDTIFRVGLDLNRKLDKHYRLASAIHLALQFKMPYSQILYALICGMYFRAGDEFGQMYPGDIQFSNLVELKSLHHILENRCGFNPELNPELFIEAEKYNQEIITKFNVH